MTRRKRADYDRATAAAKVEKALGNGCEIDDLEDDEVTDVLDIALNKLEEASTHQQKRISEVCEIEKKAECNGE